VSALTSREIARMLAERIDQLVIDLLPAGRREGYEWRVGSVAGETGHSLGVHLAGNKAGVWCDFNGSGDSGDALDLVCAVRDLNMGQALSWSRLWLGLDDCEAELPWRDRLRPRSRLSRGPILTAGAFRGRKRDLSCGPWQKPISSGAVCASSIQRAAWCDLRHTVRVRAWPGS